MIKTFEEFFAAQKASAWQLYSDNLSLAEQTLLKATVAMWGEKEVEPAADVLYDYYGITVPTDLLKEVFATDLDLAVECATNGIGDTCQRELLIDAVLKKIGMRVRWPRYGDGAEVYKKFLAELEAAILSVNGSIVK